MHSTLEKEEKTTQQPFLPSRSSPALGRPLSSLPCLDGVFSALLYSGEFRAMTYVNVVQYVISLSIVFCRISESFRAYTVFKK